MNINNIGALGNYKLNLVEQSNINDVNRTNGSVFDAMLTASSKMYEETNALQTDVTAKQIAFATGESDNILELVLAQEKASTALTFTTQVTNKIIESYKEIMQVQL